jgi:3-oxoadipate enol-lactonase
MGHGASPIAAPDRGIAAFAGDIAALLDDLGFARAGLLGLSFGGMITQEFALTFPDRLAFMIVGACGPRIPAEAREAVRARGKIDPATGMAGIVDATLQRWFTPAFLGSEPAGRVAARLRANDPAGWAAGWNAISGFDALDRLGSIRAPALVVAAEHDAGSPVAATKSIADAIPGAEFSLLPGAPHMMQIENAEDFTARVMVFLRARAAAGQS